MAKINPRTIAMILRLVAALTFCQNSVHGFAFSRREGRRHCSSQRQTSPLPLSLFTSKPHSDGLPLSPPPEQHHANGFRIVNQSSSTVFYEEDDEGESWPINGEAALIKEAINEVEIGNTAQGPVKLRGPLSADGKRRPNVEQGLRYSKDEWLWNIMYLPQSYILYRVKSRLLLMATIATVVCGLYFKFGLASIPVVGHTISGGFLSLLLVFRQNSAYARFYEARTLWADAAANCRMLALDTVTYVRPAAAAAAARLCTLIAAFPDALTYTCLSRRYPLAHNVKKLVIPRYAQARLQENTGFLQPVTVVLLMMHEALQRARDEMPRRDALDNFNLYELHSKIHKLTDIVSSCEKIVKTPVPWSYTRHASRFLTVWCGTLASALVSTLGWLTIPTVVLVSWSLLGLEEIGHLMENPYLGYRRSRRARMTQPYDIGIPVFVLSNQARLEIEAIAALHDTK